MAGREPIATAGTIPARPPLRLAHRGDWRRAPENTVGAFLAALQIPGCDGIELDVRAAKGGVAVCVHDEWLSRVFGVDRRVADCGVDELEAIGVPTLEAALAAIPRRAFLDVELKGDPGRGAFEALVAGRGPALERAVISSFDPAALRRVAGYAPQWPRWLNAHDAAPATIARAVDLDCRGLSVEWHALTAPAIRAIRDAGLDLVTWTVRRRPTYERLARLGPVAICVEGPALDGGGGDAHG